MSQHCEAISPRSIRLARAAQLQNYKPSQETLCLIVPKHRAGATALLLLAALSIASPIAAQTQTQNPIQAMKDAWKKAREQQQQQQRGQQPQSGNTKNGQQQAGGKKGAAPGNLPHSSAKVDPQLMAASEPRLEYAVSDPGAHAAAVGHRGSRMVMLHDGVEGPKYDEILLLGGSGAGDRPIVFSRDGSRYAYTGRLGNDIVLMIDGKEVLKFDDAKFKLESGAFNAHAVDFTPNSKHYFFLLRPKDSTGVPTDNARFFWDGVAGPPFAAAAAISPDGDHYAYYTRQKTSQNPIVNLIVDGKPAGYLAGEPLFTPDGKHLFTKMTVPAGRSSITEVLLDGKPIMKVTAAQIHMPSAGYNVVTVAGTGIAADSRFLIVGNKKVEGSECRGTGGYSDIIFTPDGKHYAAKCQATTQSFFVIADGKKGQEYQNISLLNFTADGTVIYFATQRSQQYVVMGTDESEPYENLIPAAQTNGPTGVPGPTVAGNHLAYISYRPGFDGMTLHVDGKTFKGKNLSKIQFSPDGAHFAFLSDVAPNTGGKLVLDGVEQPGIFYDRGVTGNSRDIGTFVFSPDSKHIAWSGAPSSDSPVRGIYIDGKFFPTGDAGMTPVHLSFTPDSKHLTYGMIVRTEPASYGVFVDGRLAAQLDLNNSLNQNEAAWQFGDDGVLNVFGQDADGFKRLRITPADDTSIASMTGAATTISSIQNRQ
jgi:hypothetical protein